MDPSNLLIDFTKTILNYGPLGIALFLSFVIFFIIKNFDLTRVKKK